jgi:hypothetical protein
MSSDARRGLAFFEPENGEHAACSPWRSVQRISGFPGVTVFFSQERPVRAGCSARRFKQLRQALEKRT